MSQKIANIVIRTTVNLTFHAMFFPLIYRTCTAFAIFVRLNLQANTMSIKKTSNRKEKSLRKLKESFSLADAALLREGKFHSNYFEEN